MGINSALGSSALLPAGLGFRNVLINGGFNINQRAFTSTTADNTFGFDRWFCFMSGATTTYSTQAFAVGNAISGQEPTNHARVVSTISGVGDYSILAQKIEDVRTCAGQRVTVSFWAKAASGTPSIAVELAQSFGSGGSAEVNGSNGGVTAKVAITTSWARYSITGVIPSISGKTVGTSSWLGCLLWTSAGSNYNVRTGSIGIQNNTIDFWGVQLEQNYQPTPFEQRPIGVELALCQRYYETSYISPHAAGATVTLGIHIGSGTTASRSTGEIRDSHQFMVEKRATPSVTLYSNTGQINTVTRADYGTAYNGNRTGSVTDPSRKSFGVYSGDSGAHGSALLFHFVAEAEL